MLTSPWAHLARWSFLVSAVTTAAVLLGGSGVWVFERDDPRANLHRWGDCVWWSVTTLTTVGYGEHYPVTMGGRLVAVIVMITGVGIIGAVAAMVAFAFAGRLAQRLEAAVSQVESQVEQVEAEVESVSERVGPGNSRRMPRSGLREIAIAVTDADTAASLTWLLARLGWHPQADAAGVSWRDGGLLLRVTVQPWDLPLGPRGRLTFGAGHPERLLRISQEATRHGFLLVPAPTGPHTPADPVSLCTPSAFEVTLVVS